ncbi:MAG TPA: hypothetical protein VNE63_18180 [Candidatus Acidoferrales bacterium]|nr:hypothetical protein [Candidatus Acidoferrales bacterium]
MANSGSWSGVIINSGCTVDEAFAEAAKRTEKVPKAKLALYDDTTRKMYELSPQAQAMGHLGNSVTVHGALEADTIHVSSCSLRLGSPSGGRHLFFPLATNLARNKLWKV